MTSSTLFLVWERNVASQCKYFQENKVEFNEVNNKSWLELFFPLYKSTSDIIKYR